jgi:hypothetical protein
MQASEVVSLAVLAPVASPCVGTHSWAAAGVDDEVRACATEDDGVGFEGVMANGVL